MSLADAYSGAVSRASEFSSQKDKLKSSIADFQSDLDVGASSVQDSAREAILDGGNSPKKNANSINKYISTWVAGLDATLEEMIKPDDPAELAVDDVPEPTSQNIAE